MSGQPEGLTAEQEAILEELDARTCEHGVPGSNYCPRCLDRRFDPWLTPRQQLNFRLHLAFQMSEEVEVLRQLTIEHLVPYQLLWSTSDLILEILG